MMSESAALGFLQVRQGYIKSLSEIRSDYDLAIATVSWESRCSATAAHLKASGAQTLLLRFTSSDKEIIKRKDQQQGLIKNVLGSSHSILSLEPSLQFEINFPLIESQIRDLYAKHRRPLRVLVDASCIPKRYLLCLLGMGFRREYVCSFDVLYSEGNYDAPSSDKLRRVPTPRGLVSEGEWTSVQVPFYESSDFAARQRDLCISTGAEISVALPLIERMDARRIHLIEISGAAKRVAMANHEKKALAKIKSEPNVQSRSFELYDVIGLARHLLSQREIAMTCMAIGAKPHAIALAIAGLSDDLIEVVCRAPGGYVAGEVRPTGEIYRYILQDRFEPGSYLSNPKTFTVEKAAGAKPATTQMRRKAKEKQKRRSPSSTNQA